MIVSVLMKCSYIRSLFILIIINDNIKGLIERMSMSMIMITTNIVMMTMIMTTILMMMMTILMMMMPITMIINIYYRLTVWHEQM
jgi:hypothetical protein